MREDQKLGAGSTTDLYRLACCGVALSHRLIEERVIESCLVNQHTRSFRIGAQNGARHSVAAVHQAKGSFAGFTKLELHTISVGAVQHGERDQVLHQRIQRAYRDGCYVAFWCVRPHVQCRRCR
eukprot:scaffold7574_cov277-Pinguiococcus_pyrenoidosus.AAC.3